MHIKTKRLLLRPIEETDLDDAAAVLTDEIVGKTYMVPPMETWDAALQVARRFVAASHSDKRFAVGVCLDGRLVGFINDVGQQDGEIELGYAIHTDYARRGYMTEAFAAVIDALFQSGYTSVVAGAFEENAASIRVMEKCGMRRMEKTENISYRGETHACVYYAAANPNR